MTLAQDPFYFSPAGQSSPDDMSASGQFDDDSRDDLFDTKDFLMSTDASLNNGAKPKKSSSHNNRKGPEAADKRATHNAIERARRENLNGRFMTLAEALPSMADVKRPSKSIIVNKALEFVYDAQIKENALVQENNELRREVDQLRARLGMPALPPPNPLPGSDKTRSGKGSKSQRPPLVKAKTLPSFATITPPDNVADEINAAMGIIGTSPTSEQASTDSPASTNGMCTSPGVQSFLPMFSPLSENGSLAHSESPSSISSFVSIAPFMHSAAAPAPTSTVMPSQMGFVHPAALLSPQQQSMLLAVQYQQQVQQQQNAQLSELYGTLAATNHANVNTMGMPWGSFPPATQQSSDAYRPFAAMT